MDSSFALFIRNVLLEEPFKREKSFQAFVVMLYGAYCTFSLGTKKSKTIISSEIMILI